MESLGFAFLIMIPVMAKNELHAGAAGMGFIQAGAGMGMFLAPLVMAIRGDAGNKPRTIFLNALAAGVALVGFALSRSLLLSVLLAMVTMALLNAYDLTLGALMQLVAPPHLRGRAVGPPQPGHLLHRRRRLRLGRGGQRRWRPPRPWPRAAQASSSTRSCAGPP